MKDERGPKKTIKKVTKKTAIKKIDKVVIKNNDKKIALIAGAYKLPFYVKESLIKSGYEVFVVGLKNFVDPKLKPDITIRLGEGGTATREMKKRGITKMTMVGAIGHPNFSDIRPDWWSMKIVAKVMMSDRGYSTLFDALLREIEKKGFKVVGAHELCPDLVLQKGTVTKTKPNKQDWKNINRAVEASHLIGRADIGQAVVVDRLVLGLEGADGTDALINRCGAMIKSKNRSGVFAKLKKPQQDLRVDLPAFGMGTMKTIVGANIRGIVLDAKYCFMIDMDEVIDTANKHKIFIQAI